jgi:hypothetical protein
MDRFGCFFSFFSDSTLDRLTAGSFPRMEGLELLIKSILSDPRSLRSGQQQQMHCKKIKAISLLGEYPPTIKSALATRAPEAAVRRSGTLGLEWLGE